jgi:hypothetical protein
MGARRVKYALGPVAAMFAFATLRTAFDFLASFSNSGGSVGTPAAAEVSMPMLIQVASLVGFPGITFLLSIVPAGISASMHTSIGMESLSLKSKGFSERTRRRWKLSDFAGRGGWCRKEDSNP